MVRRPVSDLESRGQRGGWNAWSSKKKLAVGATLVTLVLSNVGTFVLSADVSVSLEGKGDCSVRSTVYSSQTASRSSTR